MAPKILTPSAINGNYQYSGKGLCYTISTHTKTWSKTSKSCQRKQIYFKYIPCGRQSLTFRCWLHLSPWQACLGWEGSDAELSNPPWLAKLPQSHIIKGCLGLAVWVEESHRWARGWHGVLGRVGEPWGAGRAVGALRAPAPTWLKPWGRVVAHGWGSAEAELSSARPVSV